MTVTEHLMRPGNGSIRFRPGLTASVSKQIMDLVDENAGGVGAHIVITDTWIDPQQVGDAGLLAAAIYTGRITARPSRTSLEFAGLADWLDTYLDATVTRSGGTPTQWLGDLLANDLSVGSVSGGSNVSKTFPAHITTRREALDVIAGLGGWEYRVQPDFTVDAGTSVFRSPPEVIVTRKAEGPDQEFRGVDGSMLDQRIDVGNLATKAIALAQGAGAAIAKGSATASRSLKAPKGSTPELVTVFSAPGEETANANSVAQSFLNLQGMRREVAVSSSTHHLPRYATPGDEVYVYDLASGLVDTSSQETFRGQTIFPALVRLLSLTWPIEQGYGVFIRSNAATPTYIDVTPWVEWESGDTWWTIGDWAPANYGRVNRTAPEIEERVAGSASAWQTLTLTIGAQTIIRTPQWRYNAGRIELRGEFTRTASMAPATTIAALGSGGNPPTPSEDLPAMAVALIAAATPDSQMLEIQIDSGGLGIRTTGGTWTVDNGDTVKLDTVSWPDI